MKILNYSIYAKNHPDGTAHRGTAIIIRTAIKHADLEGYKTEEIQATTVIVEDGICSYYVSSVYCPTKHKLTESLLDKYFTRSVAGGYWSAKPTYWGSSLISTRERQLKIE